MCYKKLLLFVFFLLIGIKAFPAVFTVTSNADSGPGTLRDALTQAAANGTATQDIIQFNLADTSTKGRTIILVSQLPDLSSNLVIDATAQVGWPFGESNAKVEVSTPGSHIPIIVFNGENLQGVEFYGLYIHDTYDIGGQYPGLQSRTGVKILNSTNIILGAAGKGNVIRGFNTHSLDIEGSDVVQVQGNVIGLGTNNKVGGDGFGQEESYTAVIYFSGCNHISFGGDDINQGNIVFTPAYFYFTQQTNDIASIKSNNFGVYKNGISTEFYFNFSEMVQINTAFSNNIQPNAQEAASVNMDISNNVAASRVVVFSIQYINGTIDCTGNYFNIARDGVTTIENGMAISAPIVPFESDLSTVQLNVGSNNFNDRNFFNRSDGVIVTNNPNVFLRYNDFKCMYAKAYVNYITNNAYTLPVVAISSINTTGTGTTVTGTSTPNATIDIYSSESCTSQCSIRSYQQTVTADNSGNWNALINFTGIFYVSATVNNQTSLFQTLQVNSDNVVVTNLRCNDMASITGLKVPAGVTYYWVDQNGKVVSTQLDLQTTQAGTYTLVLSGGCITSNAYQIADDRFVLDASQVIITNISCGQNDGAIKNLNVYDPLSEIKTTQWFDASGTVVANTVDVSNLAPGTYSFKATTTDGCVQQYGPVTLTNTSGPNIDQSKAAIQSTNCGQSAGSITGITATGTGTLKYIWWNSQQQTVSTGPDLLNQPAGTYKLEVTDDSQCGPVYTTDLTIPQANGITMDETLVQTTPTSCSATNGSITGIAVTGATQYQWLDANSKVVGTTVNLLNIGPGEYTLTASNSFGCTKSSKPYTIFQLTPTVYPQYQVTIYQACTGKSNGGVNVPVDALVSKERWVNNLGETVNYGIGIANVPAGIYELYLTDQNGCETLYGTYEVPDIPQLVISGLGQVTNDACSTKSGSVTNIQVSGGRPPYTYAWLDANGSKISSSPDISGLAAGAYTFTVNDQTTCGIVSAVYNIEDQDVPVPAPIVNNVLLCNPGGAILTVVNPVNGDGYRLYASETSTTPLDQQSNGVFTINVKTNTVFYVSQFSGECESQRTAVQVTVGLSSLTIENTFTPNGDGINDYWKIASIENYPAAVVQVFTRYGQLVFESKGYASPFDGTFGGKKLPDGVYYYIINLNSNCSLLSGSLTIIR